MRGIRGFLTRVFFCALVMGSGSLQAQSYEEKKIKAWSENHALLEPELIPPCSPDYTSDCFLQTALNRLMSGDIRRKSAVDTFIHLTDTITKSENHELIKRVLDILQSLQAEDFDQELELKTGIMKAYFALDDFDSGLRVLKSFKRVEKSFYYDSAPPIVAFAFFINRNDLVHANKIAIMTKDWTMDIKEPFLGCFTYSTRAEGIINLINANLKAGNFDEIRPLISLATASDSLYYAANRYSDNNSPYGYVYSRIGDFYDRTPSAPKPPKKACDAYLDDYENNYLQKHKWLLWGGVQESDERVYAAFKKMGCQEAGKSDELKNFPILVEEKLQQPLFIDIDIWSKKMESCFKDSLVKRETNDPSVLTPYCISKTISPWLD